MFEPILPGIFVLYPREFSSNSYLIKGEKTAIIDPGHQNNALFLEKSLLSLGLKPSDIAIACHTHGHADHFGSSSIFKNAEILMSKPDAGFISRQDPGFTASTALSSNTYPKITGFLQDGQLLDLGDYRLEVIATPGHTAGGVCFFMAKHKLLFSGDTLFEGRSGRCDLETGDTLEMIKSLKKLSKIPFTTLLPGHGPVFKGNQKQNIGLAISLLE